MDESAASLARLREMCASVGLKAKNATSVASFAIDANVIKKAFLFYTACLDKRKKASDCLRNKANPNQLLIIESTVASAPS